MGARDDDLQSLAALPVAPRRAREGQPILQEGERPTECFLIADGFCTRAKMIPNGRRQILSIHLPGDLPNLHSLHVATMDHDLVALSECMVAALPIRSVNELIAAQPGVRDLFWRDTLVDAAIAREWIVNVGQRASQSRLAHMIVELRERLRLVGRVIDNTFALPLTQEQLGEALGVTSVHTNRILRELRMIGVLELQRGTVRILNEARLQELAQFDSRYLHLAPAS
jgi:CRP-like cAMP-binding protein